MDSSTSNKRCIACHKELPDHAFHVSSDGRRHPRCKKCRSEYERQRKKKKKDQRLDAIEADAVDAFCKAARIGGSTVPHSAELVETIMEYLGGVGGFSNLLVKQYYDSPPGGQHRTKILDTIVRLITNNTAMGGAKKPLSHWSEDELEDELRQRLIETAITLQATPNLEYRAEAPTQDT
jgi:hypothetical protein